MDRNSIIGIVLIGVILIGYSFYMQPTEQELKIQKEKAIAFQDSINKVEAQKIAATKSNFVDTTKILANTIVNSEIADSIKNNELYESLGVFANGAKGENEYYTIENELIKIKVSSKGGRIVSAILKKYDSFDSIPVNLINEERSKFNLTFFANNRNIKTEELYFVSENKKSVIINKTEQKLSLKMKVSEDKYIEYIYSLKPESYFLEYSVNFIGLNNTIASNIGDISLDWHVDIPKVEQSAKNENLYTNLYYKIKEEDVDYLSETGDKDEDIRTALRWVGFKDQFFSIILIAKNQFSDGKLSSKEIYEKDTAYIKSLSANLSIPYVAEKNLKTDFIFYFGPNKFDLLQDYSETTKTGIKEYINLEKIIPLGWGIFGWVNRFAIIPIFDFLNRFISNYGIIILLLTLIIKIVLFPLTYKSYSSTAKMRVLKPQIDEINAKIPKEKAMERQKATMALYKKVGVNPLGGCLPMLLQFPILIAMFRFFPASIELRHESFLWATDLSSYDSIYSWTTQIPLLSTFYGNHISLFTLLMTASTLLYTKMQNEMSMSSTQMPGMKTMMYLMPIMFLFFLNSYASGLTYYYFLANMITFAQMYLIKKSIKDEDVLKKLETSKAKPIKKSKFQERLEKMAKERGYKK